MYLLSSLEIANPLTFTIPVSFFPAIPVKTGIHGKNRLPYGPPITSGATKEGVIPYPASCEGCILIGNLLSTNFCLSRHRRGFHGNGGKKAGMTVGK